MCLDIIKQFISGCKSMVDGLIWGQVVGSSSLFTQTNLLNKELLVLAKEDFEAKCLGVWSSTYKNNEALVSDAEKANKQLQLIDTWSKLHPKNEKVKIIEPTSIEDRVIQYAIMKYGELIEKQKMKEIKEMDEKDRVNFIAKANLCTPSVSDNTSYRFFEDLRSARLFRRTMQNTEICKYGLPEIIDVEVINNCVTVVTFSDGTKEKAVLDKADTFNLEQGISICITKKLLAQITGFGGTKVYNGLIKRAIKKYNAHLDSIEAQKQIDEQKKKKYEKIAAKKAKRKAAQREARINEQAEAYRRAFQAMNTSNSAE